MQRWLLLLALLVGLLALVACAAEEKATPAPSPTGVVKPAAEQEWEKVLAAAKQEGKVAVAGPTGATSREALTTPFEKKYGITVEFLGVAGPELPPRVEAERAAGQYLWDIWVGGATDMLEFKDKGYLDPIEPTLILPEVKESKNWLEEKLHFADKEGRFILVMGAYSNTSIAVNTDLANLKDLKSYKDLLEPKWQGKILLHDPRVAGPSNAFFVFAWQHKELGADFIKALLAQKPQVMRDQDGEVRALAQGQFPICIGCSNRRMAQMKEQGVKSLDEPGSAQFKEGGYLSSGSSNMVLFNRAPHPNAAKVYINWLLGREAQAAFLKAQDQGTWRADVVPEWLDPSKRPNLRDWPWYKTEEARKPIDEMRAFVETLMR
ncbi:MAG TPA: extracellular solute-binding protein [Dehalococcoidia bacterium]|nr:extracellular solute-binding protein [Dehalococcoidia bacterium]